MPKAGRKVALRVAEVFLNTPGVMGVEVIGSVARGQKGNDLDLAVIVSPTSYTDYVLQVNNLDFSGGDPGSGFYQNSRFGRLLVAFHVLKFSPTLAGWLKMAAGDVEVDVHLVPENWHEPAAQQAVQQHLPHSDPSFVSNVAKDAVRLNVSETEIPGAGKLLQPSWP